MGTCRLLKFLGKWRITFMYSLKEILEWLNTRKMKVNHLFGEEISNHSNLTDLSLLMMPSVSKSPKVYDFKGIMFPPGLIDKEETMLNALITMDEEALCFVVLIGKDVFNAFNSIENMLEGYLYFNKAFPIIKNENHVHFFMRDMCHTRKLIQTVSNMQINVVVFRNFNVDYYSMGQVTRIIHPSLFIEYYPLVYST